MIEEKRKEMERFKRMKVYRGVTRESMEIKWVTNKGMEEHPIAKACLVAREFNTGDKRGECAKGDFPSDKRRKEVAVR